MASVLRSILWGLSLIYRVAIHWRNKNFDSGKNVARVEVPVISVGNLTTGGTGKSPMVIWLAQFLRKRAIRVSVLSRGYGASVNQTSDEALELEQRLADVPHLQNPSRVDSARIAIDELEMQAIVLDDAFQHRKIARDLDIVLVDCTRPFGFGHLIPRGLLREPIGSLRRADFVVLSRCDQVQMSEIDEIETTIRKHSKAPIAHVKSEASHLLQADGQTASFESLKDKKSFAFCGIGNPENFWATLERLEFNLRGNIPFPDHHNYDREDINRIGSSANRYQAEFILCTHKDLVKIGVNEIGGIPIYALVVELKFDQGEDRLSEMILKTISAPPAQEDINQLVDG